MTVTIHLTWRTPHGPQPQTRTEAQLPSSDQGYEELRRLLTHLCARAWHGRWELSARGIQWSYLPAPDAAAADHLRQALQRYNPAVAEPPTESSISTITLQVLMEIALGLDGFSELHQQSRAVFPLFPVDTTELEYQAGTLIQYELLEDGRPLRLPPTGPSLSPQQAWPSSWAAGQAIPGTRAFL